MLPKSPLPVAAFIAHFPNGTQTLLLRQSLREARLDKTPTCRGGGIARRECPDRMDVIGQDDKRINLERIVFSRPGDGVAQRLDMIDKKRSPPLQQIYGEEPTSTGDKGAAIVRHSGSLHRTGGLRFANPPTI